jgi:hypothetical protein
MVDSSVSRRIPTFHLKKRRTFRSYTHLVKLDDLVEGGWLFMRKRSFLLQGMENALTEQRESRSSIPHPFYQLELVHVALD